MRKLFILTALILTMSFSVGYADTVCTIDPATIPWDEGNCGTWTSGVYQLGINCKDETEQPVAGYTAKFDINLKKGASQVNPPILIATLSVYSTVTDDAGQAIINAPLINIESSEGGYIHICPFDDILHVGGALEEAPAVSLNAIEQPRSTFNYNPLCFPLFKKGCCETTITVKCCNPWRVFKYCSVTTQLQCAIGSIDPDTCTNISTTWSENGYCNYCTGECEENTVIELVSLKAIKAKGKVTVLWETASETYNAGFNVLRSEHKDGEYVKLNTLTIPAKGNPTQGASYEYVDTTVKSMKAYYYKLEDVDYDTTVTTHGPTKAMPAVLFDIFK